MEVYYPNAQTKPKAAMEHSDLPGCQLAQEMPVSSLTLPRPLPSGKGVLVEGSVRVGKDLESGDYILQLQILEEGSAAKDAQTQTIDFEVIH